MLDLVEMVAARAGDLLTGETFSQPEGDPCQLRCFSYLIPPKRFSAGQGHDFPYGHFWLGNGIETVHVGQVFIRGEFGLYVPLDQDGDGDADAADDHIAAATDDMQRLINGLRQLGADGDYHPYSFEEMSWALGNENGPFVGQGQDQYFANILLKFTQEAVVTNY